MMPVTPTQCCVNDLWMRETLTNAERYHRLTCTEPAAQRRESLLDRVVQLLCRPVRVHQPEPVRQLQQVA